MVMAVPTIRLRTNAYRLTTPPFAQVSPNAPLGVTDPYAE